MKERRDALCHTTCWASREGDAQACRLMYTCNHGRLEALRKDTGPNKPGRVPRRLTWVWRSLAGGSGREVALRGAGLPRVCWAGMSQRISDTLSQAPTMTRLPPRRSGNSGGVSLLSLTELPSTPCGQQSGGPGPRSRASVIFRDLNCLPSAPRLKWDLKQVQWEPLLGVRGCWRLPGTPTPRQGQKSEPMLPPFPCGRSVLLWAAGSSGPACRNGRANAGPRRAATGTSEAAVRPGPPGQRGTREHLRARRARRQGRVTFAGTGVGLGVGQTCPRPPADLRAGSCNFTPERACCCGTRADSPRGRAPRCPPKQLGAPVLH